jgi:3-deoxy-manno-octulosonate cytidylyltransferase (CMP-KDO synthetase)
MTERSHLSGTDRIAEAAEKIGLAPEDIVINVQGDQPSFPSSILTDLIRPLKEDPTIPMSTLAHKIKDEKELHNPNHVKVIFDRKGYALYFSRLPIPFNRDNASRLNYFKHLGLYAYRKEFLTVFTKLPYGVCERAEQLEQLRALENGFKIKVEETEHDSLEVDAPDDVARVEERLFQINNPGI